MDGSPKEKKRNMTSKAHDSFSEGSKNQATNKTEKNLSFGDFVRQDPTTFNFQLIFEGDNNLFLDVLFFHEF